jgi:hypothetical protein
MSIAFLPCRDLSLIGRADDVLRDNLKPTGMQPMKMSPLSMSITDWSQITLSEYPSEKGGARLRTCTFGDIRVRMVEYSPGYVADHWCSKGHIVLCLSGFLNIEVRDGPHYCLKTGQSYHVGDGDPPHRSSAPEGATLFIID